MSDHIVVMVDELKRWPHGRGAFKDKASCHLTVNGESVQHVEALHLMAAAIGLRRSWFQEPPKASTPHYDLVESKREAALRAGAVFVPSRMQALARLEKRKRT
jgi:hypothetical protein